MARRVGLGVLILVVLLVVALAVVLTGMGIDGASGSAEVKRNNGTVFAEHESTCIVYGMPRACAEMGVLHRVVPLHRVPEQILMATDYYKRRA